MSSPRIIAQNTGLLFVCRVCAYLATALVSIFVARILGSEGFGRYSIVFAYLSFFHVLTGLGIDTIVIRECAKNSAKEPALVGNAVLLKLVCGLFSIFLSWVILPFVGYEAEIRSYIYIASLAMLFSFNTTFTGLLQSRMKAHYYALPELIVSLIASVLILAAVANGGGIKSLVIIQVSTHLPVSLVFWWVITRKLGFKPEFTFDLGFWRLFLAHSWPVFLSSLFVSINTRIDQVMLYQMQSDHVLGLYSAVVKLTECLTFVPMVVATVTFPFFCNCLLQSEDKFKHAYRRVLKYMSLLALPIAVGTSLLAENFILLFYGDKYFSASSVLAILIWAVIFVFLGCINGNVLIVMELQKKVFLFTSIGAFANIMLNFWLIPKWGAVGSAWATVLSYSVFGVIVQLIVRSTRQVMLDSLRSLLLPILCVLPMAVVVYMLKDVTLFVPVVAGSAIYTIMLFATRCIDETDKDYVRQVFLKG